MKPFFSVQAGDAAVLFLVMPGEAGYKITRPMKKQPISGVKRTGAGVIRQHRRA